MGGMLESAGGFLGVTDGPQASINNSNPMLTKLDQQLSRGQDPRYQSILNRALNGKLSASEAVNEASDVDRVLNDHGYSDMLGMLSANPIMGTQIATQQVQDNPLLSSLYGKEGAMSSLASDLKHQNGQGWSLQPEDQTMYGQAAGQIARNFGQQGNQAANSLAARGLSNSGAAGATFSGLAGNQNEMLANAQQQIMQQRFQNTMTQTNALNQMGLGAQQAIQQQAGRQTQGYQNEVSNLAGGTTAYDVHNQGANNANLAAADFKAKNKPENFMDQSIANSNTASNSFAKGLGSFGAGAM